MKKNSDVDSLIGEALENIRDDRKLAREFLNEIANQIALINFCRQKLLTT